MSHVSPAATISEELRVLLLVPTRKDALVAQRLLAGGSLTTATCDSMSELAQEIERGAAAVVTTESLIGDGKANPLIALLEKQQEWSDLPLVILMKGGTTSPQALPVLSRLTNVTILERPAPLASLLSVVQAAVRGRRRQYEMRAQLLAVREAEAKALRSERAKDDFLAALSHELRTPLNPVLLLATESAGDPNLPPEVRANFELIAKNANLEARLIDDLLDLTRITRGKLKLDVIPIEVVRVFNDALATVQIDFLQKSISISTEFSDDRAFIECDPVRLQQVFWNVLKNAAKFTPEHGRISIRTFRPDARHVSVEIKDSGVGMTPDELGRIFEAFTQGNHSNGEGSHRFGGLGLGLAISRSLIHLHQGQISATSEGPHLGSTFTISLPLARVRPALKVSVTGQVRQAVKPGEHLRILLVEDHAPTRSVLSRLLEQRQHEVKSAGSLSEARSLADTFDFNLLMTDLGLPDGSGYDLMAEFRDRPGVTGIALTGYGMDDDIERSAKAGFSTHLIKPLQIQTLDAALKVVVTRISHTKKNECCRLNSKQPGEHAVLGQRKGRADGGK